MYFWPERSELYICIKDRVSFLQLFMIKISFFLLYTYFLNRALSTLKGLDCALDLQKPDLI